MTNINFERKPYKNESSQDVLKLWCLECVQSEPVFVNRSDWDINTAIQYNSNDNKLKLTLPVDIDMIEMVQVLSKISDSKVKMESFARKVYGIYLFLNEYGEHNDKYLNELKYSFRILGFKLFSANEFEYNAKKAIDEFYGEKGESIKEEISIFLAPKISRKNADKSKKEKDEIRRKKLKTYFKSLLRNKYKHWHDFNLETILKTPTREIDNVIFEKGKDVLKKIEVNKFGKLEKIANWLLSKFNLDIKTPTKSIHLLLKTEVKKEELSKLRLAIQAEKDKFKRENLLSELAEKEMEIANELQKYISDKSIFKYDEEYFTPNNILEGSRINCIGSTLLATIFLRELGIKFVCADAPDHILVLIVTSNNNLFWKDFILSPNDERNNFQLTNNSFESNIDNTDTYGEIIKLSQGKRKDSIVSNVVFPMPYGKVKNNRQINFLGPEIGTISTIFNNQAITFYASNKFEFAEQFYKKSIEINPNSARTLNNYAVLLVKVGRYEEAEMFYKRALEINNNYALVHRNYATLLRKLKRKDDMKYHLKIYKLLLKNKKIES